MPFLIALLTAYSAPAYAGIWERLALGANAVHSLFKTCVAPKVPIPPDGCEPTHSPLSLAITASGQLTEETYLAALAGKRADNDTCALVRLGAIQIDSEFEKYADALERKTNLLSALKYKIDVLYGEIQGLQLMPPDDNGVKLAAEADEVRQHLHAMEAVMNSIGFRDQTDIKRFISSTVIGQAIKSYAAPGTGLVPVDPVEFRRGLRRAMKKASESLSRDISLLRKGVRTSGESLNRAVRESLVQDKDLVEAYQRDEPLVVNSLGDVYCRVDAKYGTGAKMRDYGLEGLTIVTAIASFGLSFGANLGIGVAAETAILAVDAVGASPWLLAARGLFSTGSVRTMAVIAGALGTTRGAKEIEDACLTTKTSNQIIRDKSTNRCEAFTEDAQTFEDCVLDVALTTFKIKPIGSEGLKIWGALTH